MTVVQFSQWPIRDKADASARLVASHSVMVSIEANASIGAVDEMVDPYTHKIVSGIVNVAKQVELRVADRDIGRLKFSAITAGSV